MRLTQDKKMPEINYNDITFRKGVGDTHQKRQQLEWKQTTASGTEFSTGILVSL